MSLELDHVVDAIANLERRQRAGDLTESEYLAAARALWQSWLGGSGPEANVLKEVLAVVGRPECHTVVQSIWSRWLEQIRVEEGI